MRGSASCFTVLTLLAGSSGCSVGYHHVESELHSDGSISRAILQPSSDIPEPTLDPGVWDQVTWGSEVAFDDLETPITALPVKQPTGEPQYFAAWKRFSDFKSLPDHFVKTAADPQYQSRFERNYHRNDYGLVIEHLWHETLTDVVRLEDMRVARRELIKVSLAIAESVLTDALGEEYDVSELIVWLRTDGVRLFTECTDVVHDVLQKRQAGYEEETLRRRLHQVALKYDAAELFTKPFLNNNNLDDVVTRIVNRTVKRKDGKPVSPHVARVILHALNVDGGVDDSDPLQVRFRKAQERVPERFPGGEEALSARYANLATRVWGVNGMMFGDVESHRFTMTMPGIIVETTGLVLGASRVRWSFNSQDSYPSGYEMTCRSLEDQTDVLSDASGKNIGLNREQLVAVVRYAESIEDLKTALIRCRKEGSTEPLHAAAEKSEDENFHAAVRRVLKILDAAAAVEE